MYQKSHWIYINIADGGAAGYVPASAAYRGLLATPTRVLDQAFRRTHLGLTPHITKLFRLKNVIAVEKEIEIETVRRKDFPESVSRLHCIYCWPDQATARLAPKFWSTQGKHFNEKYLVEIGITADRPPTIVDTRWIDKFVINSSDPLSVTGDWWIKEYWKGSVFPWTAEDHRISPEPLYECLVDGIALIYGTDLRMEAYSLVAKMTPEMTPILERGRLGVEICTRFGGTDEWRLGHIIPTLMSNTHRSALHIRHLVCLDNALGASINEKIASGIFKPNEINFGAINIPPGPTFTLANLRPLDADCGWLNQHPSLLGRVHDLFTALFQESGGDIAAAIESRARSSMPSIKT